MNPLLESATRRWMFLGGMVVLLLLACSLVAFKLVKVKMLPFDNKSEFQVIVDMPDGTPLEQTTRVAQELGRVPGQAAGSGELSDLCGHVGPVQLQRTGAALFSAARRQPGRHPGEPAGPQRAQARRATKSPSGCGRAWSRSATSMVRG